MKPTDDIDINWGGGRFYSKASGDCLGGGGSFKMAKRPTNTEKLYQALKAVYLTLDHKNNTLIFDVIKDRSGNHGVKNFDEAIDFCAEILCQLKLNDSNHMFQESLKLRLVEVMRKVLLGDDCIPTNEAIKEYIERTI